MVEYGNPAIIKNKIMEYLQIDEDEYDDFINKSLKKYNAVIAGGFVLSCFSDFVSNDIDIYIKTKDMIKFAHNLPAYISPNSLDIISNYDSIGKKYVQRMLCYKYDEDNIPNYNIKIDIVIVDDKYEISQVIDNFDLTFCKIWFDGDKIYASHPNDITNKKGTFNKLYLNKYYNAIKNNVTQIDLLHLRNKKYTDRGFKINIAKDPYPRRIVKIKDEDGIPLLLSEKQNKENLIVKKLLQNFTSNNIIKYFINDIKYYSKYISKYISGFYYDEFVERYNIEKITLFKFYFICLFKEYTFKEYVANFHKLFYNIDTEYIYRSTLYILEDILRYEHGIHIKYNYDDPKLCELLNANIKDEDLQVKKNIEAITIMDFIINDKKLNKYEKYKFLNIVDHSYVNYDSKYTKPLLIERHIDIHTISSQEFKKLLKIKKKCTKLITKDDVKKILGESKLTGFDFINCEEDVNIFKYLEEDKENIIIVLLSPDNTPSITCISKKDLDNMISDINDNWFYDCDLMNNPVIYTSDSTNDIYYKQNEYLSKPYIKVPLSSGTYYFEYNYIYNLFISKQRVFFVYPKYEYGTENQIEIEKTASYKNTNHGIRRDLADYVSANHCQDGSNIKLYIIKTLKFDKKLSKAESLATVSSSRSSSDKQSSATITSPR